MAEERLPLVRQMIMARRRGRAPRALDELLPFQQADFEGIFEAMAGLPVTIRLLDPPLHEFLPPLEEAESAEMRRRIRPSEENPMLGTRGCRLGLLFPEIYEMQVQAIVRAALAVEDAERRGPARRDHASARGLRRPPGERDRSPYDDQAVDGLAALEGYTTSAAVTVGEQGRLGQIRPGFAADLTVFADDPVECDPDELARSAGGAHRGGRRGSPPSRPSGAGPPRRGRCGDAAGAPRATCSPSDPCPDGSGAGACRGGSGASRACRSAPRRRAWA